MYTSPTASVCVIFATKGRPEILGEAVRALAEQTLAPSSIIVSAPSILDAGDIAGRDNILVVTGSEGLTRQRNAALRKVPHQTDIVVFFDDDFIPHPQWLESVATTFSSHPDIVCITGNLIADGVSTAGLSLKESLKLINNYESSIATGGSWIRDNESPYGCNMAFRLRAINGLEFDERLVHLGWLEDRDFGARLALRGGRLVKVSSALGVHRGVKTAKMADRCLGYAQVVNPAYLFKKGTMTTRELVKHLVTHVASNMLRSWAPEPYVDRVSRFRGNIAGLCDLAVWRVDPERACEK